MLGAGDRAPRFSLQGTDGTDIATYALDPQLADGPVLLSFFPFAFSPVCTEQICNIRDVEWFSIREGFSVLGISTDSPFAQRAFAAEHDVDFPLLSDGDGAVADSYGVLADGLEGVSHVAKRATVLVDESGTIRHAELTEDHSQTPDLSAVKAAAADIQAD